MACQGSQGDLGRYAYTTYSIMLSCPSFDVRHGGSADLGRPGAWSLGQRARPVSLDENAPHHPLDQLLEKASRIRPSFYEPTVTRSHLHVQYLHCVQEFSA